MSYSLKYSERAKSDLAFLKHNDPNSFKKAVKLLDEIMDHPKTGTGKVENLKGANGEYWSSRINQKDRLIYTIYEMVVEVHIVSARGHYSDK